MAKRIKPHSKMIRIHRQSVDAWDRFRAVIEKDNPDHHVSDTAVLSICIEIAMSVVDEGHVERSAYFKEIPADQEHVDRVKKQMEDSLIRLDAMEAQLKALADSRLDAMDAQLKAQGARQVRQGKPETQDSENECEDPNSDERGPGKIEWPCGM